MASEHDERREQAGLYVLGALTVADRAAFEAHLASCAECAADVRALSPIAGGLAQAAAQTDPPPALRARVLAAIGAGPADAANRRAAAGAAWPWLAAASLLLAVALGGYAVELRGRVGSLDARLHEAMLRADASERQVADARRTAAEADSKVAVLAAPDLARIDLLGQPVAPQASARAYWSRSRGLVFTAASLPALPAGRVYQFWVIAAQTPPISNGWLVRPDANGRAITVFDTPVDMPKPAMMAVTIEPDGGVPAPTGSMYLVGKAN